jgi:hypothetical protein
MLRSVFIVIEKIIGQIYIESGVMVCRHVEQGAFGGSNFLDVQTPYPLERYGIFFLCDVRVFNACISRSIFQPELYNDDI